MNPDSPNDGMPRNPYANSGVAPSIGINNSMRHQASQVVGVNIAQAPQASSAKDSSGSAGRTIALVVACLTSAVAIIVMVSIFVKWQNLINNNETDTAIEVEAAKLEQQQEDMKRYAELDKQPWRKFEGVPDGFGALTFEYPRTWSAYVEKDGLDGDDFEAYFRPAEVLPISDPLSRYALRLKIEVKPYETAVAEYDDLIETLKEDEENPMELKPVGPIANFDRSMRYDGVLTEDGSISGSIVLIKVNNATAYLQMDSENYREDFDKLLQTLVRGNRL